MSPSSPNVPRRPSMIRVLVADDHRTFAEALRTAIRVERGLSVVAVTHDGETTIEGASRKRPDVILMDVQMPGVDGITATRRISEDLDGSRVIMLSEFEDEHTVARALDAGAGVAGLTRRETEILQGLARGLSPSRLSEELGISRHTLRTHQQNILFKLKVHSKHEALVLAIRHGKIRTGETV